MKIPYYFSHTQKGELFINTFCPFKYKKGKLGNWKVGSLACQNCKDFESINQRDHYVECNYRKPDDY